MFILVLADWKRPNLFQCWMRRRRAPNSDSVAQQLGVAPASRPLDSLIEHGPLERVCEL